MKWATSTLIHFDRVASAWLILRFVDEKAEFNFLEPNEDVAENTIAFGIPGARLAAHDGKFTTFQRILAVYDIQDLALIEMGRVGADIVDHVMHDADRSSLAKRDPSISGILAFAEGAMLLSASDSECLARSLPFYDALYARLVASEAIERLAPSPPASVLDQTLLVSQTTRALRVDGKTFSAAAFASALPSLSTK